MTLGPLGRWDIEIHLLEPNRRGASRCTKAFREMREGLLKIEDVRGIPSLVWKSDDVTALDRRKSWHCAVNAVFALGQMVLLYA